MISLVEVDVEKDGRRILRDLNVELRERRIAIIGRNGSGKSMFAKLLNGIEKPSRGEVRVDNRAIRRNALRNHVGFVFQNPDNQIVYPIVGEDLAFGLKHSGLGRAEIEARIDDLLERFGVGALKSRFTHELSGGEKQLVALIGVLVMRPAYIVLDEPTTLLDLPNRNMLSRVLDRLEQNLIVASHDLDLVRGFDRAVLIEQGRIVRDGPPARVIEHYVRTCAC